jgi:3-oxoadipate enol-lactonase
MLLAPHGLAGRRISRKEKEMTNIVLVGLLTLALNGGVPVDRGVLPVNGAKLAYEVAGRGPSIVLIHAGVADMSMWDEPFHQLSKRYQVIRYDMRGFGASKTEAVEFSNRQDLLSLMDHLKIDKAILVGNSRGGIIALDFTLEYPSRVAGLVSVAGSVSGFEAEPTSEEKAVFDKVDVLMEKKDIEAVAKVEADIWVNGPVQKAGRAPREIWERVHRMILHNYRMHTAEAKPIGLKPPAIGRLAEVRVPILAMVGDLDETVTQAAMALLAAKAPNARRITYRNTAHMISLERPREFVREVTAFAESIAKQK